MQASPLIFMLLMFGVFWFIVIRPQVKKQKEHQALLSALKPGDVVTTRGGLIGKVTGLTDKIVTIELQEKVRVRVLRSFVEGHLEAATKAVAEPSKKSDDNKSNQQAA